MIRFKFLLLIVYTLAFFSAFAQTTDVKQVTDTSAQQSFKPIENCKFYFQFGFGYNFVSGIGTGQTYTENPNGTVTKENHTSSLGKGAGIDVGFGYKFTKNLGVELGLGYVSGGKNNEEYHYNYNNATSEKNYIKANTFQVNPKITFDAPLSKRVSLYSKIGYLIGAGNGIWYSDRNFYDANTGHTAHEVYQGVYTGGIVSGTTAAIGVRCHLADNVSFFSEITFNSLSRTFDKYTLQKATSDGQDVLQYIYPYYQEINYVDESTTQTINTWVMNGTTQINTSTTTVNLQQSQSRPAYKTNYSSVGFRLGLIIHF